MTFGRRSIPVLVALLWALPLHAGAAPQPSQTTLEYSVKANYLVRFAAFVEWPAQAFADARSPVILCVVGRDPFSGALGRAAHAQTAYGRPLMVRRPVTQEAAAGCHILYVGAGGASVVPSDQPAILQVTDGAVSADRGMIHFVVSEGRVRFHIDLQAASRSRLSISSRLLNLALSVRGG